jgi:hypothetical protein
LWLGKGRSGAYLEIQASKDGGGWAGIEVNSQKGVEISGYTTGALFAVLVDTKLTKFGCNSATPQAAYASGGAVSPGAGSYGASSAANFAALATLVANIRTALVNNGIMS